MKIKFCISNDFRAIILSFLAFLQKEKCKLIYLANKEGLIVFRSVVKNAEEVKAVEHERCVKEKW